MEIYKENDYIKDGKKYSKWIIKCLGSHKELKEIGKILLDMSREGVPGIKPIEFIFNDDIVLVRNHAELFYFAKGLLVAANTFGVKLVSDKIIEENK